MWAMYFTLKLGWPRCWWHGWPFSVWCSAQPGHGILCYSSSSALLFPPSTNTMNWISTHLRVWTEPVKSTCVACVLPIIQFITLCVNTKFSLLGPYWCSGLMIWLGLGTCTCKLLKRLGFRLECALTVWVYIQTTPQYYPQKQQEKEASENGRKGGQLGKSQLSAATFACR